MKLRRALAILVMLPLPALARAQAETPPVVIEREPPSVETRTFDPRNPPATMPALRPGEAAVTESNFACQTVIGASVVDQVRSRDGCTATVQITSVKTSIRLGIVIWLPTNGSRKLTAHEQGHRTIDERFYAGAEEIATRLSKELIGQRRVGKGSDCDAAAQAAIKDAGNRLCGDYMAAVQQPAARVQELYDDITDHGRNRIHEAEAIKRAVARQQKESAAATKPAVPAAER